MRGKPLTQRINDFKLIVNINLRERKKENAYIIYYFKSCGNCILHFCNHLDYKGVEEMSIGKNIKRIRKDKGLTQQELALKVGVSQPMIGQIERETKIPTMLLGKEIADVLNCSLEDLITE